MKTHATKTSGASQRSHVSQAIAAQPTRSEVSWQEILAVLFGVLGGIAYYKFTQQPAQKKQVVLVVACLFGFITAITPSPQETARVTDGNPSVTAEPSTPSTSVPYATPSSGSSAPNASAPPSGSSVEEDCSYGVCTRTYQAPNGDTSTYSSGYGHSYDVHTRTTESNGKTKTRSWDSEGNSYSVESYCDSGGCHTSDSEGNRCSVLSDGTLVGCD